MEPRNRTLDGIFFSYVMRAIRYLTYSSWDMYKVHRYNERTFSQPTTPLKYSNWVYYTFRFRSLPIRPFFRSLHFTFLNIYLCVRVVASVFSIALLPR